MSIKLSFILPCYNVERYIVDCLNSIYSQDMPEDEFEVICVNDCSTDGTRDIIAQYMSQHQNLTLIDHEKNMNVGAARNSGLEVAKGEYIWFVDPDDMIRPNIVDNVYQKAKADDVDALLFNNEAVDEKKAFITNQYLFQDMEVISGQEFVVRFFPNQMTTLCIVWRCLFKTTFIKEKSIVFPAMCKGEDVSFLWRVLIEANHVKAIRDICYTYRKNPYSIGGRRNDPKAFFSTRILFANEILRIMGITTLNTQIRDEMLKALNWCANSSLYGLSRMSHQELKSYYREIVSHKDAVRRAKLYMNRKNKFVYNTVGGEWLWLQMVKLFLKKR